MSTTPNTLNDTPEAFGARVRINGGTTPRSIWMLNNWMSRADRDMDDDECPAFSTVFETRELALQGFRDEMQCEIDEWEEGEAEGIDLDAMVRILDEQGSIGPDHSFDGTYSELVEVPLWSGTRRKQG